MEKSINRQQMQSILDSAPQGVDKKALIDKFVADGYTVEGINDKKEPNILQSLVGGIAKAPATLGQSVGAGAIAGFNTLTKGGDLGTNYQEASKLYQKSGEQLGGALFGESVQPVQNAEQLAGNLLQTGAALAPGNLASKGASTLGKVGLGALEGAGIGAAFLGGEAMADNASAGEVAQQALTGATFGAPLGAVLPAAQAAIPALKAFAASSKKLEKEIVDGLLSGVKSEDLAASILTKQVRLTPTQRKEFMAMSGGLDEGQYLVQKGIYKTNEGAVEDLAKDWLTSFNLKKEGLAQLPDQYTFNPVNEAINELVDYERKVGVAGTSGLFTKRINELASAAKTRGLTLSEIDDIKSIYERTVALGYGKEVNTAGVEKATRITNSLREFIETKAESQGFTNVRELNKNTQLSRSLAEGIEDRIGGRAGNNFVGLSDSILAAGVVVDPSALAILAGKKIVGMESVQAAIAKKLGKTTPKPLQANMVGKEKPLLNAASPKQADFLVAPSGSKAGQFESTNKKIATSGQNSNQATPRQLNKELSPLNESISQTPVSSNGKVNSNEIFYPEVNKTIDFGKTKVSKTKAKNNELPTIQLNSSKTTAPKVAGRNFGFVPPVPTQDENGNFEITPESVAFALLGSIGLRNVKSLSPKEVAKTIDSKQFLALEKYVNNPTKQNAIAARSVGQDLGLADSFLLKEDLFKLYAKELVDTKEEVMNNLAKLLAGKEKANTIKRFEQATGRKLD